MLILERSCGYDDILRQLKGKKALIWGCNTCARLCNGMGGDGAASKLADKLRNDGINVIGTSSSSASCIMHNVLQKRSAISDVPDVIVSLSCPTGARNVREAFGCDVLEPFVMVGVGYIDSDGNPRLFDGSKPSNKSSPLV